MLFNRFLPIAALISFGAPILAAPISFPRATGLSAAELQEECDKMYTELEDAIARQSMGLSISSEELSAPKERTAANSSMAAVFVTAQSKMDSLQSEIDQVMAGPIGSMEGKIGKIMIEIDTEVKQVHSGVKSFIGAESSVVYGNPDGGALLTTQLANRVLPFYILITVKNISGYTFTSAQQSIRKDITAMKKTLSIVSSELADEVSSTILISSIGYTSLA
ncbi:hypothetical protein RhiXN_04812 [Rhizoctonia solani]|uniref:Uncharacterized protein n=1 Tax=Rhizoctonia solani TaxID=456999 RepID=A0A8H8NP15_9AGAM|nr:uncharacterized protein RhiXN_04812 [Rhizoctonia solani]QRW16810.1 hypothetical protein RhiXN_04812 [Rhizoctonia solani]